MYYNDRRFSDNRNIIRERMEWAGKNKPCVLVMK